MLNSHFRWDSSLYRELYRVLCTVRRIFKYKLIAKNYSRSRSF